MWFFGLAWVMLTVILALSHDVRELALHRMPGSGTPATLALLAALLALLAALGVGVARRWRWLFWLLLLAFTAGLVRVPLAILQLSGQLVPEGPDWYVVLQGNIGVVQAGLAYLMFGGYRRAGPWGAFRGPVLAPATAGHQGAEPSLAGGRVLPLHSALDGLARRLRTTHRGRTATRVPSSRVMNKRTRTGSP